MKKFYNPERTELNIPLKVNGDKFRDSGLLSERILIISKFLMRRYGYLNCKHRIGTTDDDVAIGKRTLLFTLNNEQETQPSGICND